MKVEAAQGKQVSLNGLRHLGETGGYAGELDCPVAGKRRGKATDPLIHSMESMTLLLQLGRKEHVHAPTRDED